MGLYIQRGRKNERRIGELVILEDIRRICMNNWLNRVRGIKLLQGRFENGSVGIVMKSLIIDRRGSDTTSGCTDGMVAISSVVLLLWDCGWTKTRVFRNDRCGSWLAIDYKWIDNLWLFFGNWSGFCFVWLGIRRGSGFLGGTLTNWRCLWSFKSRLFLFLCLHKWLGPVKQEYRLWVFNNFRFFVLGEEYDFTTLWDVHLHS